MHNDKLSILIIEDNISDLRLIKEFMSETSDYKYLVEDACCLSEGIEKVSKKKFDVVLLDLNLPDSEFVNTVFDFVQKAKNIPIIILTGLDDLGIAINAIDDGAQDYLIKGQFDDRILKRSIHYAIERKRLEIEKRQFESKLNDLKNKYQFLSFHDSLTGLYNRMYFDEEIKRIDNDINRFKPVTIVTIDINNLKDVNDKDGHEHGDILIKETANILSLFIRKTDFIARIGGDEFCAILLKADMAVVNNRKEELLETIKAYNCQSKKINIDIAIGIASTQEDESINIYGVVKKSDELMYINKRLLKNKSGKGSDG